MKELHFTVSQILEDFTKGCGATFIIIVLIMSQKVCKKKNNPDAFCCKTCQYFNTCPPTSSSLLYFLHHFVCIFWHKWYVICPTKTLHPGISFNPDPRKRCLLTPVTFEEQIQYYKPTLKSSTATNEIHSGALCFKPLLDAAQHLSMLVTMYQLEIRQKCFTPSNQREAVGP